MTLMRLLVGWKPDIQEYIVFPGNRLFSIAWGDAVDSLAIHYELNSLGRAKAPLELLPFPY
jgi:hypothetical protein